jgi:putative oxidoreductase
MENGNYCWSNNIGKLLLRISIGGLLLFHGVDKIMHKEHFAMVADMVKAHNLPDYLAYGVFIGEIGGAALVLIGFLTRIGALIVAINMGVAVWLVHVDTALTLGPGGGWALELQGLYFLGALCILFLGPGQFSIDGCLFGRSDADTPPPSAEKKGDPRVTK